MATAIPLSVATPRSRYRIERGLEYWHLLSLDAPTVAALWSIALCHAAHVPVPWSAALLIGLGTWLLYAADRVLDGVRPAKPGQLRERHHFHAQNRCAFLVAWALVAGLSLWVAATLIPGPMLMQFGVVAVAALGYFALVHTELAVVGRWFPKELAVGVIFAAAVAIPAWSQLNDATSISGSLPGVQPRFAAAVLLFAALCWLNCTAIESWERTCEDAPSELNPATKWAVGHVRGIAAAVATAALMLSLLGALAAIASPRGMTPAGVVIPAAGMLLSDLSAYLALALAASLLLLLDCNRSRLSPMQLRIAADAALLTPLLFLSFA